MKGQFQNILYFSADEVDDADSNEELDNHATLSENIEGDY